MKLNYESIGLFLVVFLSVLAFTTVIEVKAQTESELLFPVFKYQSGNWWTILGRTGGNLVLIDDGIKITGQSKFLFVAMVDIDLNTTIDVYVYEKYEKRLINGSTYLNATIESEKHIPIDLTFGINMFDIGIQTVEGEYKWIEIRIIDSYFLFQFQTRWDDLTQTWRNIDLFFAVILANLIQLVAISLCAMFLSKRLITSMTVVPPFAENGLLPLLLIIGGGMLGFGGFVIRPPNTLFIILGVFTVFMVAVLYIWSRFDLLKKVELKDPVTDRTKIISILEIGSKVEFLETSSWWWALARACGKRAYIHDIRPYMRIPRGESDVAYVVNCKDFVLPRLSITRKKFSFEVRMKPFQAYYYTKSANEYMNLTVAENITAEENKRKILDLSKRFKDSFARNMKYLEKKKQRNFFFRKLKVRRFLRVRRVLGWIWSKIKGHAFIREELSYLQALNLFRANIQLEFDSIDLKANNLLDKLQRFIGEPYDLETEQKMLAQAGADRDKSIKEINILRQKIIVGTMLSDVENLIILEKIAFPKNYGDAIKEEEFVKLQNEIRRIKQTASEIEPNRKAVLEPIKSKKEKKGGKIE